MKIDVMATGIKGPGSFRLGRYKIIIDGNNMISWQCIGKLNRTISGKCIIESGILFIGQKEIESDDGQSRRGFFSCQKLLPQWDKTFGWGHYGSLRVCKEPRSRESDTAIWKPESVKISIDDNIPFTQRQKLRKDKIWKLKVSYSGWLKTAWHRFIEWNGWGCIKPLIIAGIFFGLRILLFILKRLEDLAHAAIGLFRKYRAK